MPIVDIELVGEPDRPREELARALAGSVGKALGAPEGRTWIKLRVLDSECYAESGAAASDVRPVFVSVLERALVDRGALSDRVRQLTSTIAAETRRPEDNVHITFEPAAEGRQAFGGVLVD